MPKFFLKKPHIQKTKNKISINKLKKKKKKHTLQHKTKSQQKSVFDIQYCIEFVKIHILYTAVTLLNIT